jgi:1-deoxy-D-xylulose-5-phosphate synthase
MGVPDKFIEHGSVKKLWEEIGLTEDRIISVMSDLLPSKQQRA